MSALRLSLWPLLLSSLSLALYPGLLDSPQTQPCLRAFAHDTLSVWDSLSPGTGTIFSFGFLLQDHLIRKVLPGQPTQDSNPPPHCLFPLPCLILPHSIYHYLTHCTFMLCLPHSNMFHRSRHFTLTTAASSEPRREPGTQQKYLLNELVNSLVYTGTNKWNAILHFKSNF